MMACPLIPWRWPSRCAIPKTSLKSKVRSLTVDELAELDLATDEAIGRVEPSSSEQPSE